jgi:MFS-type transporter involved in bile tolerance (Atg22 family)
MFTFASILLLLTAPILGSIADKNGHQQKYLNRITIITFSTFLGVSIVTLFFSHQIFLAILFFILANYFYQFSIVFYNALLHHIAPPES